MTCYPMAMRRPGVARALAAVLVATLSTAAMMSKAAHAQQPADTAWTGSIVEEDDFYTPDNRDRHYTHGIRLGGTSGDVQEPDWQAPFQWLPLFPNAAESSRRYQLMVGQNMYTPENLARPNPDPRDRPYAGWLYGGFGLMQDTEAGGFDQFDHFDMRLGIVGPSSGAAWLQTRFHLLIDVGRPQGWSHQIHDEPALDLFRERKWRFYAPITTSGDIGVDAIPQVGLRVGNVYDYVGAGGMVRVGRNLRVDYSPPHIDENLGADYVNPAKGQGGLGWYFFLGTEGRLVGHNIFLDGNSFRSSRSVAKEIAVGDAEAGLAVVWDHLRLAYTYVYRSNEFVLQDHPDHYGSLNLTFRLPL